MLVKAVAQHHTVVSFLSVRVPVGLACVHSKGIQPGKMPSKIIFETEDIGMEGEMDISAGSTTPKKMKEKKIKEGKKIKKQKTVVEEEPDCEPPAPKKKKKKKKKEEETNGNAEESPLKDNTSHSNEESADNDNATEKKKKKKGKKTDEKVVVNGVLPETPKLIAQTNGHTAATTPAQSSEDSDSGKETETPEQKEGAFSNFRISPNTIKLLQARGISYLFDIQTQTFNSVYEGKDVIGQARTGTGKTLAFAIPLIEKLQNDPDDKRRGRAPKILCLAPTRELAIQVSKDFKDMTKKLSVTCFYGGSSYNPQLDAIRSGIDILVGTPGRIKDHLQNNKLDLSQLKHVVLDEVDQMLDMGFAEQVEEILSASYQKDSETNPQTLLFSATCPSWVYDVAKRYMRPTYEHVDLIGKKTQKAATTVEHLAIACHWSQRAAVIGDVVQVYSGSHGRTIVFCETKKDANELSMNASIKQSSQSLHGDIPQKQREITLKGFRSGTFEVLVATNVAARGLDIPEVDLVVQCSPPKDVESYIHRSGRTGRAGRTGVCICFYQRKEEDQLRYVEQKAGITFKRVGVPTANDIIKSSSKDAVRFLDSVPPQAIEYFRVSATKLIEERGAVEALSAALAHISGATALEQRSLLNSDTGYTTMTMNCSQELQNIGCAWRGLKEQLGEEIDNMIRGMTFLKGKMGVCFDVPADKVKQYQDAWQDGRRWQLSIATELPELEEKPRMGGDRGYGRSFGGQGGGRGFRNGGGGGNWRGGGSHKRTFSSAFDY
ncbi:nucleolar RNA helicase 2 isoform X3 [Salmo salar]|uniref:RNA helicase n=2 Tax=Salmo salar TaxID=8030 RepID=A0A1S3Q701_SALSA|nr:nucleolar RNA helicase 2 isoform X3 [Salmo salar]|eukprot:XP_014035677.1 PREDICTED: nucleolar RNA helicase 2 isoform X2 [Salmo salar]